jgi:hypothetical protein
MTPNERKRHATKSHQKRWKAKDVQSYHPHYKLFKAIQQVLYERARAGYYNDSPDLEARLLKGYDPAIELATESVDPNNPLPIRFACLKTLLPFLHTPLGSIDTQSGDGQGTQITINIAAWAAAPAPKNPQNALEVLGSMIETTRTDEGDEQT